MTAPVYQNWPTLFGRQLLLEVLEYAAWGLLVRMPGKPTVTDRAEITL